MKGSKVSMIVLLLGSFLSACGGGGGGSSGESPTTPTGPPGLGPNPGQPTGGATTLPDSISIVSVIGAKHTEGSRATPLCADPNAERPAGNEADGMVDLCVTLRNDLVTGESPTGTTQVVLPAGLLFVAKPSADPAVQQSQNGFLAQAATVSVSEGQSKTLILRTFCINRALPSSDRPELPTNWEYGTAPTQTDVPPLQEIATILADRLIQWGNALTVQAAIWNVTENNAPLNATDRANLQALPPKTP